MVLHFIMVAHCHMGIFDLGDIRLHESGFGFGECVRYARV